MEADGRDPRRVRGWVGNGREYQTLNVLRTDHGFHQRGLVRVHLGRTV